MCRALFKRGTCPPPMINSFPSLILRKNLIERLNYTDVCVCVRACVCVCYSVFMCMYPVSLSPPYSHIILFYCPPLSHFLDEGLMYCCLHDRAGTLATLLYVIIHCSPAPVLVHKLVGLLESIEKLPIYLYESSTSYSLQVCNSN